MKHFYKPSMNLNDQGDCSVCGNSQNFPGHIPRSGSLHAEFVRTAEMVVEIAERQGIYHALQFFVDTERGDRLKEFLPILKESPGAIKK